MKRRPELSLSPPPLPLGEAKYRVVPAEPIAPRNSIVSVTDRLGVAIFIQWY